MLSVVCGLLFSAMVCEAALVRAQPSPELAQGLIWLGSEQSGSINAFSYYTNSAFIQYFSNASVLIDDRFFDQARYNDSERIFGSLSLKETKALLEKYDITHIIITKDMTEGLVWDGPGEGLMRVLGDNETFMPVYSSGDVYIWKTRDT